MNTSVIQSMINAIDRPAIFITPEYVIQAVNQAYSDTYEKKVALGRSKCFEISHQNSKPCDQCGELCPMQRTRETGRATSVVHIHHTDNGESYCDILMKPVFDIDGSILGYLEILDKIKYASSQTGVNRMMGVSEPFKAMLNRINRAARSTISVLLQGETGTGKELVAHAVHQASERADKPFVVIECTGLSESLFESELFGHEKGAFTGAAGSKKGLIEIANGGTVFFDEIGDVPLNMQVKLLRLLETGYFRAVGGLTQKRSDFRLVCATHKNLLKMVEDGEFRQDLYYRIAGFPIHLPPLRERRDDIPLLVAQFLEVTHHQHKTFSQDALATLLNYGFPGNIRELKSIVEQAVLMSDDEVIHISNLPPVVTNQPQQANDARDNVLTLEQVERQYLQELCSRFDGSMQELADQLDLSQRTLYRKLERFGLRLNKS